jgi:amino acid transporter
MLIATLLIVLGLLVLGGAFVWMHIGQTFWRDIDDSFDINPAATAARITPPTSDIGPVKE